MSQEIINVLEYIGEKLGIVIDWTSENIWPQIMDILGRYRILQIVINCLWFTIALITLVVFIRLQVKISKAYRACIKDKQDNLWWYWYSYSNAAESNFCVYIVSVLTVIAAIFIIITLIITSNGILKWAFIPEIQFLELFKSITG